MVPLLCTPFKNRKCPLTNGHSGIPVMTAIFCFNMWDDEDILRKVTFSLHQQGEKNRLRGAVRGRKSK